MPESVRVPWWRKFPWTLFLGPVDPAITHWQEAFMSCYRDEVVLAKEAADVLRGFYDDVTPCVHRLKAGERCALCGRARALLIECDGLVEDAAHIDGPGEA